MRVTSIKGDGCDEGASINRILELRDILPSFQTGFNLVNAAVARAILESISGLEPSSVTSVPRYSKPVTISSFCHTLQQPLQNHPLGHLGGRTTPWSAEEMLDGQHQRVDILAHARTAHKGPPAEKTGRGSLLNRLSCPLDDPIGHGTELN